MSYGQYLYDKSKQDETKEPIEYCTFCIDTCKLVYCICDEEPVPEEDPMVGCSCGDLPYCVC